MFCVVCLSQIGVAGSLIPAFRFDRIDHAPELKHQEPNALESGAAHITDHTHSKNSKAVLNKTTFYLQAELTLHAF